MRWIWIDRILELTPGRRCVAIKNVSLAEDVLHDHFPAEGDLPPAPVLPAPLIIEGMAQTAGILTGATRDFREKVILAKISKAVFTAHALPGTTLRYTAELERIDDSGAMTRGIVERLDPTRGADAAVPLASIDLIFSHVDQNRAGLEFPEHNFVFASWFRELILQNIPGYTPQS
ncbi:MAG: beta-hydroxyacyl-ACP dehydratase [Phycisphaeraceae bacterium]|nr:beta-hydroxyacyl-ACP dehydratase [Phycisphaeraceae bacterium]